MGLNLLLFLFIFKRFARYISRGVDKVLRGLRAGDAADSAALDVALLQHLKVWMAFRTGLASDLGDVHHLCLGCCYRNQLRKTCAG